MLDFKILKFYALRADFCAGGALHTLRSFLSLATSPCFFGIGARPPVWALRIALPYPRKNISFAPDRKGKARIRDNLLHYHLIHLNCQRLFLPQFLHILEQFFRFSLFDGRLLQSLGLPPYGFFIAFDLVSNGITNGSVLLVPKYGFQLRQLLFADCPAHLHITVFQVVHGQQPIILRDSVDECSLQENTTQHDEHRQKCF